MRYVIIRFIKVLLWGCMILALSSCFRKEDFDMTMLAKEQDIPYDLALPLVSADLTVGNLTGDLDLFSPDKEGLIHLVYGHPTPTYFSFADMLKFPDLSFPKMITPMIPYFKVDTVLTYTYTDTMAFDMGNGIEIDRILLDSFDLNFNISSRFDMDLILGIKIPNIVDSKGGGYEFKDTISRMQVKTKRYKLCDYSIVLDKNSPGIPSPVLEVQIITTLDFRTANNTALNPKDGNLSLDFGISNLKFAKIKGYFGNLSLDFKDTIPVPGLENQQVNGFEFTDANLLIDIINGASMPIRLEQSSIEAFYKEIPSVTVDILPDNYDVPYPAPTDQPMEKTTQTKTSINNLIVNFPTSFGYSMQGVTNPEQNENIRNVIDKNSSLAVNMYVDVPLNFSVDDFIMRDTFPLSLAAIEKYIDMIELFELKVILTNAFPIDATLTLVFLDANTDTLFSMALNKLIAGGKVDPNTGHVIKPSVSFLSEILHHDQVTLLAEAKYIGVYAKMSTTDKKKVKIYQNVGTEGFMSFKIGTRIKIQAGSLLNSKK